MRPLLFVALASSLLTLPARAAPPASSDRADVHCDVNAGPDDRLAKDGDLIVQPGEVVEDAIALHGDVIVRRGARVRGDVLALDGSVRIEAGAQVGKSAVAFGGKVLREGDGRVDGSRISVAPDGSVELAGDEGDGLTLSFSGQDSLGRKVVDALLSGIRACRVDAQTPVKASR
jgi:hypothetical protein